MIGLIATLSVVKGPDAVEGMPVWAKAATGALMLAALVLGVLSIRLFTRAAYGDLKPVHLRGDPGLRLEQWRQDQYEKVGNDIRTATGLTYAVIVVAVAAVALSWVLPR